MIETEVEKATRAGVEHNNFLFRYPQSVTQNGEAINVNGSLDEGYGAWRMTREDYELVVPGSTSTKSITYDLLANVNVSQVRINLRNE